jgi:hypothetical protein
MSMNTISDGEIERMRNESHWGGRAAALEELEISLRHQSGEAFAARSDTRAGILRELSIHVGKKALDERKRQKDFQKQPHGGVDD